MVGYDDVRIAKEDGVPLISDEEYESESTSEKYDDQLIVRKILRYFTHRENDDFAVFVECGLNRTIKSMMSNDRESIELTISIPLPPDDLLHSVGFMHASKVSIEETNEIFT